MSLALAVGRREAERALGVLNARGLLDDSRRIERRPTTVLLPLRPGCDRDPAVEGLGDVVTAELKARSVGKPIDRIRRESGLPRHLADHLPRRWARVGDVLLLRLPPQIRPHEEAVGRAYATTLHAKAVVQVDRIGGERREPQGRVIHGPDATTVHREHGVLYSLDAARLMFSKGNQAERQRIATLVRDGERVVDMFAGVGYFALPIAVHARPGSVLAVEKNPLAWEHLVKNVLRNDVVQRVGAVLGDCRQVLSPPSPLAAVPFDRAILGYIPDSPEWRGGFGAAWEFLGTAERIVRPGGAAHFHALARRGAPSPSGLGGFAVTAVRRVKSFGPETYHVVLDLERNEDR